MSEHEIREYQNALEALKRAEEEAAKMAARVAEALRAAGKPADLLVRWKRLVPINNGTTFEDATWLNLCYDRVDVTGWPLAQELVNALGKWNTARVILENARQRLTQEECRWAPPLPPEDFPILCGRRLAGTRRSRRVRSRSSRRGFHPSDAGPGHLSGVRGR
jgi:hypothetical protein